MITYKFVIKQMNTTTKDDLTDVVSHIHFDYVGTDENDKSAFCQGVIPFQIVDHTFTDPNTNQTVTVPSIVNHDSFTPYEELTEEIVLSWIEEHLPEDVIQNFQQIITEKLSKTTQQKSFLPWQ